MKNISFIKETKRASCFQVNVSCRCLATPYHRSLFAGLCECTCLTQTLRFEGAPLGFKQLVKVRGLHTLELILDELQTHIFKSLFQDISNYIMDFLQFSQSLQSQIEDAPISNPPPFQDFPFALCLSLLLLGHSLCSS